MNITELLSQGWEYRGEGNANVAISLQKGQTILRIPKTEKPKTLLGWFIDRLKEIFKWDCKKQIENERRNLEFYNYIMAPYFGHIFAHPAFHIRTYPRIIKKLQNDMMPCRPEYRKHKQLQIWTASLFTDYTFYFPIHLGLDLEGETFSIEIKPKQGWIPISERHNNKCLFCSNQFLKLKYGQINEISFYCPLDLFSGDAKRIMKALKALIYTPQNNLKLFKNGLFYYGQDVPLEKFEHFVCELFGHSSVYNVRLLENFCCIILQALLKNFEINYENFKTGDFNENPLPQPLQKDKCAFEQSELPQGCILKKILDVQKLNRLGLDKYKDAYVLREANNQVDQWNYVNSILKQNTYEEVLQNTTLGDLDLVSYLLAAVAYDCSLIITLRKVNKSSNCENNPHLISDGVNNFLVNIGILDLYPKPSNVIMKHVKRNTEISMVN